jgi:hypothetical protein
VPLLQPAHWRSLLALGEVTTLVPAGQLDQGLQEAALIVVLWVPLRQGEHVRSVLADPAFTTKVPAEQSVLFTQAVAGFASLSQVSPRHWTRRADPPAQNSPASHAVQLGPDVVVGGDIMKVPAGQSVAATHATWSCCKELLPTAHGAQTRSLLVDGKVAI